MKCFELLYKYLNDCGNLNHSYACGKLWNIHNTLNSWYRFSLVRTFLLLLLLLLVLSSLLLLLFLSSNNAIPFWYHNLKWIHFGKVKSHDPILVCKWMKRRQTHTQHAATNLFEMTNVGVHQAPVIHFVAHF